MKWDMESFRRHFGLFAQNGSNGSSDGDGSAGGVAAAVGDPGVGVAGPGNPAGLGFGVSGANATGYGSATGFGVGPGGGAGGAGTGTGPSMGGMGMGYGFGQPAVYGGGGGSPSGAPSGAPGTTSNIGWPQLILNQLVGPASAGELSAAQVAQANALLGALATSGLHPGQGKTSPRLAPGFVPANAQYAPGGSAVMGPALPSRNLLTQEEFANLTGAAGFPASGWPAGSPVFTGSPGFPGLAQNGLTARDLANSEYGRLASASNISVPPGVAASPTLSADYWNAVMGNMTAGQWAALQAGGTGTGMGFPAAGLAGTPSGGYASSGNAPQGSRIGTATISYPSAPGMASVPAPPGYAGSAANLPSVYASNMMGSYGAPAAAIAAPAQAAAQAAGMTGGRSGWGAPSGFMQQLTSNVMGRG